MTNSSMIAKKQCQVCISKKYFIYGISFLLSFYNSTFLALWLIFICIYATWVYKSKGAIEAFLFVQVRSILNPGIAVSISSVSIIKWLCVFYLAGYILFFLRRSSTEYKKVFKLLVAFAAMLIVTQPFISSYPTVAIFKIISWIIPFLALLKGIGVYSDVSWIKLTNRVLGIFIVGSLLTIPFPVAYLRNGHALQGFFNHPNLLGVMCVIFLAGILYECNRKMTGKMLLLVAVTFFQIFLSESRTSFLAASCIILLYFLFSNIKKKVKIIVLVVLFVALFSILVTDNVIRNSIIDFLLKGNESFADITHSRDGQIESNLKRFFINPLFGTGFNVPYQENIRSYSFSFDLITENGNIALALLGDTGIIGTLFFTVCFVRIFLLGKGNSIVLFAVPFLVCMGEMAFFSTNNFGIILYMYFAIYMQKEQKKL